MALTRVTLALAVLLLSSAAFAQTAGVFNVKSYGAIGNGGGDDSAAFTSAINASIQWAQQTGSGAVIYVPPGTYRLTKQLGINGAAITLRGEGPQISILLWAASNGGITYSGTIGMPFTVRDIGLVTNYPMGGTALSATWAPYLGSSEETAFIDNVEIRGQGVNSSSNWTTGIALTGAGISHARRIQIRGRADSAAHYQDMLYGILLQDGGGSLCDVFLSDIRVWFSQYGVINFGADVEGINITHSSFTAVGTGLLWNTNGTPVPHLVFTDSFVNAYYYGINTNANLTQAFVAHNLFYQFASGSAFGVVLGGTSGQPTQGIVTGNIFTGAADGWAGVVLLGNSTYNNVSNNTFVRGTGVWLQPGSSDNQGAGNIYVNVISRVLNQGARNTIQ